MSKSPKAAIIRAVFASFPGCAVRIAAGSSADIVAEAKALIADGVKEINLISQDSTYYGLDLRPNHQPRHFVAGKIFGRRQVACPPMPRPFARCCAS